MSLPIQLQSIKSSGVYRFVYDKSVITGATAETLRLLVGYSDKGPFNTPVYITSRDEFVRTYGNISKRLEKKGIFFHRLALQALNGGPLLCLNLKPFGESNRLQWTSFKASTMLADLGDNTVSSSNKVTNVYDTNRFWTVNAEDLADFANAKYAVISATDSEDSSCTIIARPCKPAEYDLTIREYYLGVGEEAPDYLQAEDANGKSILDDNLSDYFADIYVFKGKFTEELCGADGVLGRYFNVKDGKISLEENYVDSFGEPADVLPALAADENSNYIAGYRGTSIPFFRNANGSYVSLDILFNSGYADHKMLMNLNETMLDNASYDQVHQLLKFGEPGQDTVAYYKLTATGEETVTYNYAVLSNPTNSEKKKAVEMDAVPTTGLGPDSPAYIKVNQVVGDNIYPVYIKGFAYDNTEIDAAACIGVITGDYGKGLQEALTNRMNVEYHYLVDTFDTIAGPKGAADKLTLAALAKKKDNCFAILNYPKIKDFVKDPSKKYNTNNTLDFTKVIKDFTMPSEADGASWAAYFTQIVMSDGAVRYTIPSAGLVSNEYMAKWSSRQPYYIVAGSQFGRLWDASLIGPDYQFSKTDRDILEPYGLNVIIYEPRRGTYINSEQTAKQVPVSALSKIHVRELVIYLQDEIAELLESYRWELNTPDLRNKIKAKADTILDTVKNNGGVYDYENICDDTNNTPETIDNEFLVLDTHIEPARGCSKMVERLYIYRTGEMRSALLKS